MLKRGLVHGASVLNEYRRPTSLPTDVLVLMGIFFFTVNRKPDVAYGPNAQ